MAERNYLFAQDRIPNDSEGLLSDEITRRDVVRRVVIARIDLRARDKSLNVDGARVLYPRPRLCDNRRHFVCSFQFFALAAARLGRWLGLFRSGRGRSCTEGAGACLCACLLQLLVLNDDELALPDSVAACLVVKFDALTGHRVDQLLAQTVPRRSVYLAEGDALAGIDGRIQRNRARHERELQVPLPIRPRGHWTLHAIQPGGHPLSGRGGEIF